MRRRCIWSQLWAAWLLLCGVALVLALTLAHAQEIHFDGLQPAAQTQRVSLASNSFIVDAGKPEWIELSFHIQPGFHINSHLPHDQTLIPTALKLDSPQRIHVLKDAYPPGIPLRLNIGAGETLSTYAGDFRVRLQLIADKGGTSLSGALHYQACDTASCYPPRDLPFTVTISAR